MPRIKVVDVSRVLPSMYVVYNEPLLRIEHDADYWLEGDSGYAGCWPAGEEGLKEIEKMRFKVLARLVE